MGSALEGGLIALAGPGAPRLAPTVYQFVAGASGRVVLCGCHPVASFTQASIRRVWELRVRVFFPLPVHAGTVSHPVNAWNTGRGYRFLDPAR